MEVKKLWLGLLLGACLLLSLPSRAQTQSVTLSWTASVNCPTCLYNVWRSSTSGGPYTKVTSFPTSSTSYTETPASSGTYYYVTSSFFPGGTAATINFTASGGIPNSVKINTAGFGYTNVAGTCPNCGLLFQQRQNGPFVPGDTGGGEFPIDDGPGGGSGGAVFCTNADTSNAVFDSIKQCSIVVPGAGYTSAFTEDVPSDQFDTAVDRPWNAQNCIAYWTIKDPSNAASICANPVNRGGFSNETKAIVGTVSSVRPSAPHGTGVWK